MRSDPELLDMSVTYIRIFFLGVPFTTVLNYAVAILRAKGDTTTPLIILTCSGILNVVLNLFFVIVCGMGVDGVAIATVISNIVSMVTVVIILMRDEGWCRLSFAKLRLCPSSAKRIIAIGVPAGIQGTLFSISNVFIQSAVNGFGAAVVTGNSIGTNLESFVYTATNSVSQAALTFTGQNVGAGKYRRIKNVCLGSYGAGVLVGILFSVVLCTFYEFFAGLYMSADAAGRDIILDTVRQRSLIMIAPYFLVAVMETGGNVVRGMGRSVLPMIVSLIGSCLFRITWIFTVFAAFPYLWVLYVSLPLSWAVTGATHLICITVLYKKLT